MKKTQKFLTFAMGAVLALSLLAGCGGTKAQETGARICYDNLGLNFLSEADTQCTVKNVESMTATDADGKEVSDVSSIATYDAGTGILKAVSEGAVTFKLKGGSTYRVEVVPAYITDPGTQYSGTAKDYASNNDLLGWTHDPSLIEVEENGAPAYYIFSTGWETGNEIRRSTDLLHWENLGKTFTPKTQMEDIEEWIGQKNSNAAISWWAPDIVKRPNGGYWLYTCATIDGDFPMKKLDGEDYSMACIVLFESDTLEPGSFTYVGVLMQSCIPQSGSAGELDVNSIDPQIIYDEKGNMFMAYGSFGTGNWMLELNPKTGLRKDGVLNDGVFLDWKQIRKYRDEAVKQYVNFSADKDVKHEFYGTMISYGKEEAPIIARHDNVTIGDENAQYDERGLAKGKGTTYFYSMHSFNPLDSGYQMWGGRSTSVWGAYRSVNNSRTINNGVGDNHNGGNKYTGSFTWADKSATSKCTDVIFPGHNDLFTTSAGVNVAAYITRTRTYQELGVADGVVFMSQIHQYYLNSLGDIVINPNRYALEIDRSVSADELFACTDGGKFKMVALANDNQVKTSVEVILTKTGDNNGTISKDGAQVGTWVMYGKGYIKFEFTTPMIPAVERVYYGVVRPAWLDDQNKSGFTITCMGHTENFTYSTAMFMNNVSNLTGEGIVG